MSPEEFIIEVRNANFGRVGQILAREADLVLRLNFCAPGEWTLELPAEHPMTPHLEEPGAGLVFSTPRGVLASGPVKAPKFVATPSDPEGTVSFIGTTDMERLWSRLVYPEPYSPAGMQNRRSHWEIAGWSGAIMHEAVLRNLGSGALPERRDPRVDCGAMPSSMGRQTKISDRWSVLGDFLANLGPATGVAFDLKQEGTALKLELTKTPRSGMSIREIGSGGTKVRFDVLNGSLESASLQTVVPTATRAIVAGQGELTQRRIIEVTTPEASAQEAIYGRMEVFIDRRDAQEDAALIEAGGDYLADNGILTVSCEAVPSGDLVARYGSDWKLGDVVTVVMRGREYLGRVTGAIFRLGADGLRVGAIVGDPTIRREETRMTSAVSSNTSRIANLEKVIGSTGPWVETAPTAPWGNYGQGYADLAYRRMSDDSVVCRGVIAGGANDDKILTLPEELRPDKSEVFTVDVAGGTGRIDVRPSGDVIFRTAYGNGNTTRVSLSGVRFWLD